MEEVQFAIAEQTHSPRDLQAYMDKKITQKQGRVNHHNAISKGGHTLVPGMNIMRPEEYQKTQEEIQHLQEAKEAMLNNDYRGVTQELKNDRTILETKLTDLHHKSVSPLGTLEQDAVYAVLNPKLERAQQIAKKQETEEDQQVMQELLQPWTQQLQQTERGRLPGQIAETTQHVQRIIQLQQVVDRTVAAPPPMRQAE